MRPTSLTHTTREQNLQFDSVDLKTIWRLMGLGRVLLPGCDGEDPRLVSDKRIICNENASVRFPMAKFAIYWLLHNVIAHPLIGLFPCMVTYVFHNIAANWMSGEALQHKIRVGGRIMHMPYGNHFSATLADPSQHRVNVRCNPGGACCSSSGADQKHK